MVFTSLDFVPKFLQNKLTEIGRGVEVKIFIFLFWLHYRRALWGDIILIQIRLTRMGELRSFVFVFVQIVPINEDFQPPHVDKLSG